MKPISDEELRWLLSIFVWLSVSWLQTIVIVNAIKDMS